MVAAQIVSIPHTGTHFLRDLLLDHGVEITEFDHLDSLNFEYESFENIVAPVRPPREVAFSWGRIGRRVDHGWEEMWGRLKNLTAHFFFLEDKDVALRRLSDHLGITLSSDWERVNFSDMESPPFISESRIAMADNVYKALRGQHG